MLGCGVALTKDHNEQESTKFHGYELAKRDISSLLNSIHQATTFWLAIVQFSNFTLS
jgi:hypothetical protein